MTRRCARYRPGYETALWVLTQARGSRWSGRLLLADVSDQPLTANVVRDLAEDVVTWRRDAPPRRHRRLGRLRDRRVSGADPAHPSCRNRAIHPAGAVRAAVQPRIGNTAAGSRPGSGQHRRAAAALAAARSGAGVRCPARVGRRAPRCAATQGMPRDEQHHALHSHKDGQDPLGARVINRVSEFWLAGRLLRL